MEILLPKPGKTYRDLSRDIGYVKLRDPSLPEPGLDSTAQDRIGRELRAMYAELAEQPVPRRFLDLLARFEAKKEEER